LKNYGTPLNTKEINNPIASGENLSQYPDEDALHELSAELLPWYVNGTLNPAEQALVARHLPACTECRLALEHYRKLGASCPAYTDKEDWRPAAAHFARILQNIDAQENKTATEPLTSH